MVGSTGGRRKNRLRGEAARQMKKRGAFWIVLFLLLILLGGGTWLFITEVNDELWNSSVRTITESTHQGVNAINIQLEADFKLLEGIWKNILSSDLPNQISLHLVFVCSAVSEC